jgi:hypothetical protein
MSNATEKCASFDIRPTKDSRYIANPDPSPTNGDKLPNSAANNSLSYLTCHISPWSGLHYKDLVDQLASKLQGCRSAPLKPHQKLSLTTSNLITHFLHKTIMSTPPISIRAMDQIIRNQVKVVLHLPIRASKVYCIAVREMVAWASQSWKP